jgi:hypothetical protein
LQAAWSLSSLKPFSSGCKKYRPGGLQAPTEEHLLLEELRQIIRPLILPTTLPLAEAGNRIYHECGAMLANLDEQQRDQLIQFYREIRKVS